MKSPALLISLACLCLCTAAEAEDKPAFDLLQSMSAADFRATGLDHLSDAQLKALDAWFGKYQRGNAAHCPAVAAADARPAVSTAADEVIVAHLIGNFTGWGGSTRFKLDNGQVWEQVDDATLTMGSIPHPKVTISKGTFNAHYLAVEGVSDTVSVRLVQP